MDGHFVPNISFGPAVVAQLRPLTKMFFDVHLMCSKPEILLEPFARAGADQIIIHVELADRVTEAHHREIFANLRTLTEKLYRRNPREFAKSGQETVDAAVARIFEAKGRPTFDPLIVHLASVDDLPRVTTGVDARARALADAFGVGA